MAHCWCELWLKTICVAVVSTACAALEPTLLTFTTYEEQDPGTFIGLVRTVGIQPPYDMFSNPQQNLEAFLDFDTQTGELRTKARLDREERQLYTFGALSHLSGKVIRVAVKVLDINDNSPKFAKPSLKLQLSESIPPDTKVPLGSAIDQDSGANSTQRYEIVNGNTGDVFRLHAKRAGNGVLYLDLGIAGMLDFETMQTYELAIKAYDGGSPPQSGSLTVEVNLIDSNDNLPVFTHSHYFSKVREDAPIGTEVSKVEATDIDSGENGHVSYRIDQKQSGKDSEAFHVDPATGLVTLKASLDYESRSSYELVVVGSDNGSQPLQSSAVVSIQIENINDNKPTMSIFFLTESGRPELSEDAPVGKYIARIIVADPDLPREYFANITVHLAGGGRHFKLETNDHVVYFIVLSSPVDHEVNSSFTITLTARDSGEPSLQSSKTFTIKVTDVNDSPPTFSQSVYIAHVDESAPIGSPVLQLQVTDADSGRSAQMSFKLRTEELALSDWFAVDDTGLIRTHNHLDCELSVQSRLIVEARDHGSPPLSATASVIIRLRDSNENYPVFDHSFYNASVDENVRAGTCILKVSASDPDCGNSSRVLYSLSGSHTDRFSIDTMSGEICVKRTLDYEEESSYHFTVIARDRDNLQSSAAVSVSIRDQNDNTPRFETSVYRVTLSRDQQTSPEGSKRTVVMVRAQDPDSGRYGRIRYSLVGEAGAVDQGNSDHGVLQINPNTGVVSLTGTIPEHVHDYRLFVRATDGGGLSASATLIVDLIGSQLDQSRPSFQNALYSFSVPENSAPGTVVGRVQATIAHDSSSQVTYSIESSDVEAAVFAIDAHSGQIEVRTSPDSDLQDKYLLVVEGRSTSGKKDTCQVSISILDLNDQSPQFSESHVTLSIREDARGTLYTARAVDGDRGMNGTVRYSLEAQRPGEVSTSPFEIDPVRGTLTTTRRLDYAAGERRFLLRVMARDLGVPQRYGSLTLNITVLDTNGHAPVFNQSRYIFEVLESATQNTRVGQLYATDADSGHNARITYSLLELASISDVTTTTAVPSFARASEFFTIAPSSGLLLTRVGATLDAETVDSFRFLAVAMDAGIPPRSAKVEVIVRVLDVNDHTPSCSQETLEFQVFEGESLGTAVGVVTSHDGDKGKNGRVEYYLAQANTNFAIHPNTGVIRTRRFLDRETLPEYTLSIGVRDRGMPPLSSTCTVKIEVMDKNDERPQFFPGGELQAEVHENQPVGSRVIRMLARDADTGENGQLEYSLQPGPAASMFSIDPHSGWIETAAEFRKGVQSEFRLVVVARDLGDPPLSSACDLRVFVLADTEAPSRPQAKVPYVVEENTEIGTVIGSIRQGPADAKGISYYITDGNEFGVWGIDLHSGEVFTAQQVDYELRSSYLLKVKAVDEGQGPGAGKTSTYELDISVRDQNDNSPIFETDPLLFAVQENTARGHLVGELKATDRDSGNNGKILYEMVQQRPEGYIALNSRTGQLILEKVPDHEIVKEIYLVVKATDQADNPALRKFSTVMVHVEIEDLNDCAPAFTSPPLVSIREDQSAGYTVLHVSARDNDSYSNGLVTYGILRGNEAKRFALDSNTGLLTVAGPLDFEGQSLYELLIVATDHGSPRLSTEQKLKIELEDVNDNEPTFGVELVKADVFENQPAGTRVVQLKATDADAVDQGKLTYQIPAALAEGRFVIDSKTGWISTAMQLDREKQGSYVLTAYVYDSAQPSPQFGSTSVLITVRDHNDHAPVFSGLSVPGDAPGGHGGGGGGGGAGALLTLRVPENAVVPSLHTLMASDQDEGENARMAYAIIGGNEEGKFHLDKKTGKLWCDSLDRERTSRYTLIIEAKDFGEPALSSRCTVVIEVEDQNDNTPEFKRREYTASMAENRPAGSRVLGVMATDRDAGQNAQLTYSLSTEALGSFRINSSTGVISTARVLDREQEAQYTFDVHATDNGLYGPRSTSAQVIVTLLDVNDHAPRFRQIPYRVNVTDRGSAAPSGDAGVNAAAGRGLLKRGDYVTRVLADDPDAGKNGQVRYMFTSSQPLFNIEPDTGIVSTSRDLTQADAGFYHMDIEAMDHGKPRLSSRGILQVRIGEKTDLRTIRFENTTYSVNLTENSPSGRAVVRVRARLLGSPHDPLRPRVRYSLAEGSGHDGSFVIDPNSGLIRVANPSRLDYELNPRIRLIVLATSNVSSGYATVWINLLDQNDNKPIFGQNKYLTAAWEGQEPGTFVMQLAARDEDSGDNGKIDYFIVAGNDDSAFAITMPALGVITTHIVLDREIRSSYRLQIEAIDRGKPRLSSRCTVKINIVDTNDNKPMFPHVTAAVEVPEDLAVGGEVTVVTANDVDLKPALTYNFTEEPVFPDGDDRERQNGGARPDSNPQPLFSIDRTSGVVTLNRPLDRERRDSYTLRIEASDTVHVARTEITLRILDKNDCSPKFENSSYVARVPELTKAGVVVARVHAVDADAGENGRVSYSFKLPPSRGGFRIDKRTGEIFTNRTVVFDPRQLTQSLIVSATDHGEPVRESVAAVEIQIVDVNNHKPEFKRPQYTVRLREDAPKDETILRLVAVDLDESHENSKIEYSITAGNVEGKFAIDRGTGELFLKGPGERPLDRELVDRYSLVVMATDHGKPRQSSSVRVLVKVQDVNDQKPRFDKPEYRITVNESLVSGTPLLKVTATDRDIGDNARVQYSLRAGNDAGTFVIDPENGVISLSPTGMLDHDTRPLHRFTVQAMDSTPPHHKEYCVVLLNVTDVNEHAPVFPGRSYHASVPENRPAGTKVFRVYATDRDGSTYGQLTYSILPGENGAIPPSSGSARGQPVANGAQFFSLNKDSGEIVTRVIFDRESQAQYSLKIKAVDPGGRSAVTEVIISIEDEDEFSPVFTKTRYNFDVPGNAEVGHILGQVKASDQDAGSAGHVIYRLKTPNRFFAVNAHDGRIRIKRSLNGRSKKTNAEKRNVGDSAKNSVVSGPKNGRRFRRDVPANQKQADVSADQSDSRPATEEDARLVIVAQSSSKLRALNSETRVHVAIDFTCAGCSRASLAAADSDARAAGSIGVPLPLVIVLVVLAAVVLVVVLVLYVRKRGRKGRPSPRRDPAFDSISLHQQPLRVLPPPYSDISTGRSAVAAGVVPGAMGVSGHPGVGLGGGGGSYRGVGGHRGYGAAVASSGPHGVVEYAAVLNSSDLSDQSQSSSGRGSADDAEFDEELERELKMEHSAVMQRAAAAAAMSHSLTPLGARGGTGHKLSDSGAMGTTRSHGTMDADNLSLSSVTDHKEYLARLGIDVGKLNTSQGKGAGAGLTGSGPGSGQEGTGGSMESMHQFSDEGGGEAGGLDIGNLVYDKLGELEESERLQTMDSTHEFHDFSEMGPSIMAPPGTQSRSSATSGPSGANSGSGSLAALTVAATAAKANSQERLVSAASLPGLLGANASTGHLHSTTSGGAAHNWEHLLNWGPQYQPLAQVFAEIAKLRDDTPSRSATGTNSANVTSSKHALETGQSSASAGPASSTVTPAIVSSSSAARSVPAGSTPYIHSAPPSTMRSAPANLPPTSVQTPHSHAQFYPHQSSAVPGGYGPASGPRVPATAGRLPPPILANFSPPSAGRVNGGRPMASHQLASRAGELQSHATQDPAGLGHLNDLSAYTPLAHHQQQRAHGGDGSTAASSTIGSLPSLMKDPLSHESSFSCLAYTPSFTPSLSPLATRSPTVSPLNSGRSTPKNAMLDGSSGSRVSPTESTPLTSSSTAGANSRQVPGQRQPTGSSAGAGARVHSHSRTKQLVMSLSENSSSEQELHV